METLPFSISTWDTPVALEARVEPFHSEPTCSSRLRFAFELGRDAFSLYSFARLFYLFIYFVRSLRV